MRKVKDLPDKLPLRIIVDQDRLPTWLAVEGIAVRRQNFLAAERPMQRGDLVLRLDDGLLRRTRRRAPEPNRAVSGPTARREQVGLPGAPRNRLDGRRVSPPPPAAHGRVRVVVRAQLLALRAQRVVDRRERAVEVARVPAEHDALAGPRREERARGVVPHAVDAILVREHAPDGVPPRAHVEAADVPARVARDERVAVAPAHPADDGRAGEVVGPKFGLFVVCDEVHDTDLAEGVGEREEAPVGGPFDAPGALGGLADVVHLRGCHVAAINRVFGRDSEEVGGAPGGGADVEVVRHPWRAEGRDWSWL